MAACGACGSTILFGGTKIEGERYCNEDCATRGQYMRIAAQVPEADVKQFVREMHTGPCPKCRQGNSTDVHTSYFVWSALVMTSWQNKPQVSCRSCGLKSQAGNLIGSLLLGWWGLPWGIVMTPVQVVRNIVAMIRPPDRDTPSPALERVARLHIGSQIARRMAQERAA